jgi:hypothetical protein
LRTKSTKTRFCASPNLSRKVQKSWRVQGLLCSVPIRLARAISTGDDDRPFAALSSSSDEICWRTFVASSTVSQVTTTRPCRIVIMPTGINVLRYMACCKHYFCESFAIPVVSRLLFVPKREEELLGLQYDAKKTRSPIGPMTRQGWLTRWRERCITVRRQNSVERQRPRCRVAAIVDTKEGYSGQARSRERMTEQEFDKL